MRKKEAEDLAAMKKEMEKLRAEVDELKKNQRNEVLKWVLKWFFNNLIIQTEIFIADVLACRACTVGVCFKGSNLNLNCLVF